jgi:hypothetical protein
MLQEHVSSTNAPLLPKIPFAQILPNTVTRTSNAPARPAAPTLNAPVPSTVTKLPDNVHFATPRPLLATKLITLVTTLKESVSNNHHALVILHAPTTRHAMDLSVKFNLAQVTPIADQCFATLASVSAKFVMIPLTCAHQDTLANLPLHLMLLTETVK